MYCELKPGAPPELFAGDDVVAAEWWTTDKFRTSPLVVAGCLNVLARAEMLRTAGLLAVTAGDGAVNPIPIPLPAPSTRGGLCYWLGGTLYLAPTNRALGLSLPGSRGPGFAMPSLSGFRPLDITTNGEPTGAEMAAAAAAALGAVPDPTGVVVFAGLGEPLLRLEAICDAAQRLKAARPAIILRVNTNGLAGGEPVSAVGALKAAGVSEVSAHTVAHTSCCLRRFWSSSRLFTFARARVITS